MGRSGSGSYSAWLRALPDDDLTALLRRRPDVLVPPPADFGVLASRLCSVPGVARALEGVDLFSYELLEVLALLGPHAVELEALAEFCRVDVDVVRAAVRRVRAVGLVWGDDDALHLGGNVRAQLGPFVRRLGRPVADILAEQHTGTVLTTAHALGLDPAVTDGRRAREYVAEVMADPARLQPIVDALDPDERVLLDRLDGHPLGSVDDHLFELTPAKAVTPVQRLVVRGLIVPIAYQTVELPREVGLALRGDAPAGALHPTPPEVSGTTVGVAAADAAGAGSAADALRLLEMLLERWGTAPVTLTRSGRGVPVRELRATAKALGVEPVTVALLAEAAEAADLLGSTPGADPAAVPTARFDTWREEAPATRWGSVAAAWLGMQRLPGLAVAFRDRKAGAVLSYDLSRAGVGQMRREILAVLADLPPGTAPGPEDVRLRLEWQAPLRQAHPWSEMVRWVLAEAGWLGVLGRGALTSAGRALVEAAPDEAGAAAAAVLAPSLPAPVDHVLVQADLTAVAPGPLVPALARDLALVADVESPGAATVYRLSEASIRRAFDAGWSAADVHALLDRAARGPVPQALRYLVDDVGRRHGRLRVGRVTSYVRCDDPSLLAQVAADRKLAALRLRAIAPTVAISGAEPKAVLDTLRKAGYAPAREEAGGALRVSRPEAHRVPVPTRVPSPWSRAVIPPTQVPETVARLRRADELAARRAATRDRAPDAERVHGGPAVLALLQRAVRDGRPLWMAYVNAEGRHSERVVHPVLLSGGYLTAHDEETGEVRTFAVSRVQSLAEAG